VRDSGCGIERENLERIFQSGFSTKTDSAGQGLTVVYATVARHNGWIDVESAPNRGATFSLYLPIAEA
jgi:signal transduction histidine kinase